MAWITKRDAEEILEIDLQVERQFAAAERAARSLIQDLCPEWRFDLEEFENVPVKVYEQSGVLRARSVLRVIFPFRPIQSVSELRDVEDDRYTTSGYKVVKDMVAILPNARLKSGRTGPYTEMWADGLVGFTEIPQNIKVATALLAYDHINMTGRATPDEPLHTVQSFSHLDLSIRYAVGDEVTEIGSGSEFARMAEKYIEPYMSKNKDYLM